MSKVIQKVMGQATSDGAGVALKRIIGQGSLPRIDPFLMLDEFGSANAEDYLAGFPPHPHRGFQTVTYMLEGKMGHRDSVGNAGLIEDGGLQWMNAGKGIIHEEMPQQTQGVMRGFQLWVNLPASEKMSDPGYQDIPAQAIPEVIIAGGKVRVLAGTFQACTGAVTTQAVKPEFWDVHLAKHNTFTADMHSQHNGFIYVYEGRVTIGEHDLQKGELGRLSLSDTLTVFTYTDSRFIVVTGKPINEPIVQYGPFVMNTQDEIEQAIQDFQAGRLA